MYNKWRFQQKKGDDLCIVYTVPSHIHALFFYILHSHIVFMLDLNLYLLLDFHFG